ncbi:hypothetical protein LZG04_30475 [Saccharothrix sp. S26]|uniref:hypothetical protein n=1 Tax=Saccharothrix sp. S26 TaxID=2907215 RepID=UPI001F3D6480|nr:hypothetical protein [Saccharothrix sp. S26]MCE6999098.1 hypothetical protein [Saccharothrix sp. S26]
MSADALLHIRAAVRGRGDNRIAVLLVDCRTRLPLPLPAALTARGLSLVADIDDIALPIARGWAVEASAEELTLRWPHRTPLVDHVAVERPGVWGWAAGVRRTVLVLVGTHLALDDPDPTHHRACLKAAAARGTLVGGAVPYARSTTNQHHEVANCPSYSPRARTVLLTCNRRTGHANGHHPLGR